MVRVSKTNLTNYNRFNTFLQMSYLSNNMVREFSIKNITQNTRLFEVLKSDPNERIRRIAANQLLNYGNSIHKKLAEKYLSLGQIDTNITFSTPEENIRNPLDFASIIMAGGTGKRFSLDPQFPEITEDCKILAPLCGIPMIEYILNSLPTNDVIVVTPNQRNVIWDKKIRQQLTPEGMQGTYGKFIHYSDSTSDDWMESVKLAIQKAYDLGFRTVFVIMGDSFIDINQRNAILQSMLSPFENIVFYSKLEGGSHKVNSFVSNFTGIEKINKYQKLPNDDPEGIAEILYMISVQDFLTFMENNPYGGFDSFFEYLSRKQAEEPGQFILGGIDLPIKHTEINVNTKAQLKKLESYVFGYPHTWWGKFALHGECYPSYVGEALLPQLKKILNREYLKIQPVQINWKSALFRLHDEIGPSLYLKIFSNNEYGVLRHSNSIFSHKLFPSLFPKIIYHGNLNGYNVEIEEDLCEKGATSLEKLLETKTSDDLLDDSNENNVSLRESIFDIFLEFKNKKYPGIPNFRYPTYFFGKSILPAEKGINSFFPYPDPDIPVGFEFYSLLVKNIGDSFERLTEKIFFDSYVRGQIERIINLTKCMFDYNPVLYGSFLKEKDYYYTHGDLLPFNIFLPKKVIDGEYFLVAPFSYDLSNFLAGIANFILSSNEESSFDFISFAHKFIKKFEEYESKVTGQPQKYYIQDTPLLLLLAVRMLQEVYFKYFISGINNSNYNKVNKCLDFAEQAIRSFHEVNR